MKQAGPSKLKDTSALVKQSSDPFPENPYRPDHPAHLIWVQATRHAEVEILRFHQEILALEPKNQEQYEYLLVAVSVREFEIWANRGISIIQNEEPARAFVQWLESYANYRVESMKQDPPKGVDIESFACALQHSLMRAAKKWSAEALERVGHIEGTVGKEDIRPFIELARARFLAWVTANILPERERRLRGLSEEGLASPGRAMRAFATYRELLEREVRERISIYRSVAQTSGIPAMLHQPGINAFRTEIMASVRNQVAALRDRISQDFQNTAEYALPEPLRYEILTSDILQVVNLELAVLEAEGLAKLVQDHADCPSSSATDMPEEIDANTGHAKIDAFLSKMKRAGYIVRKKHIWQVAGYTNATEFERYQRDDVRNRAACKAFDRVLSYSPEEFMALRAKVQGKS